MAHLNDVIAAISAAFRAVDSFKREQLFLLGQEILQICCVAGTELRITLVNLPQSNQVK